MPELPEVETVKRGLERLLPGKSIKAAKYDWQKSFPNDPHAVSEFMVGCKISSVRRRAKVLLIDLDSGYTLMTHLKMTGQLVYVKRTQNKIINTDEIRFGAGHPNDSLVSKLPDKSTRVAITFEDNSHLYFNDQRKFGWMKLLPTELVDEEPFMQKVGPEPLEESFTNQVFIQRIRRRNGTSIKAAILDQTVLAGIGNIYADEGLWAVKIHPAVRVNDISDKELKDLRQALVDVLKLAIDKGGSTNKNYVNAEGKKGSYMDFAKVFRREGHPCYRCGAIITKSKVAGRGTHTCPVCQVLHT